MRFLSLFLVAMMATPVLAQDFTQQRAQNSWDACKAAKKTAHACNPDPSACITAVAQAAAAVAAIPSEYRSDFQRQYDQLRADLRTASGHQGEGEGWRAGADGAYGAIESRIASGTWVGVEDAADACGEKYYRAYGHLSQAEYGYGVIKDQAIELKRSAEQFAAMLEAFEDWYGPSPDYGDYE